MDWIDALSGVSDIVSKHWPPPQQPKPKKRDPKIVPTIDIVIPTCGGPFKKGLPTLGLWMTLSSCEEVLKDSGFDYQYFIAANGNPANGDARDSLNLALEYAKGTGHLGEVFDVPQALSPPGARDMGAATGRGEYIVFLDDHCRVYENFFSETVDTFTSTDAGSVRGVTIEWQRRTGDIPIYHRVLDFNHPGWGHAQQFQFNPIATPFIRLLLPGIEEKTYRIGSSGHGAFAVRRSVWNNVSGYWDGLKGFGGEEVYFDLKLALLDQSIYLNPKVRHWHQVNSPKPYDRDNYQETAETIMAVANVIGGREWAQRVLVSCCKWECPGVKEWGTQSLASAVARSDAHAQWLASKRKRTLEEQIAKFRNEGVEVL